MMKRPLSASVRSTPLRVSFAILFAFTVVASGCDSLANLPFLAWLFPADSKLDVVVKRRGCSEFSRSAVLTVANPETGVIPQWSFTDGIVQTGPSVVHTFKNVGLHRVQLVVGAATQEVDLFIPVGGEADDGPDPFGDTCLPIEGDQHVATGSTVNYRDNPPASGAHYSESGVAPIDVGFYPDPVPPEVWVHNLEHGDIVILFDCPGTCDPGFLQDLQSFFNSVVSQNIVITRYPGLPSPIMAVAWQVQRNFDSYNAVDLKAFYDRRVGQAPEGEE